jgi:hypothetical protein
MADPNKLDDDFEKAAALTEKLFQKFYDEALAFDPAMGGALTVLIQCLLRGTSNQTHMLGILGTACGIAVAVNMEDEDSATNEEILDADAEDSTLLDEGSLH